MSEQNDIEDLKVAVFGCEEQSVPGLKKEMAAMRLMLMGEGENLGLIQKVNVIWRFHVWLLCLASMIAGSGLTLLVQKLAGGP